MITVCILTKNAARTLKSTLESVRTFSEVILLDNGSTDETVAIGRSYPNVHIHETPFIGFGPLRNLAATLASHDWILALDSDEVLSPAAIQEISQLSVDPAYAYVFPRHNYYNRKRIRGCGWDPEWVARLYHRVTAQYGQVQIHESLIAPNYKKLSSPLLHTPYRNTADFLAKMEQYSTLFAKQYANERKSSFSIALAHAFYAFFRSYFLKRGIFCGAEGFVISVYNANTTFYKYLKLAELNNTKQPEESGICQGNSPELLSGLNDRCQ